MNKINCARIKKALNEKFQLRVEVETKDFTGHRIKIKDNNIND